MLNREEYYVICKVFRGPGFTPAGPLAPDNLTGPAPGGAAAPDNLTGPDPG